MSRRFNLERLSPRRFISPTFHFPAVCARRFGLPHFPQASAPEQIQSSDKSEHSIGTVRTLECDDLSSLWIFLGRSTADELRRRKAISRRFNLERLSPRRFSSESLCTRRFLMSPTFPRDNRMIRFFEPISIGRGWATSFRRTRRLIASRGRRCHPIGTPNRSLTEC
jgi:hypothetical protein